MYVYKYEVIFHAELETGFSIVSFFRAVVI